MAKIKCMHCEMENDPVETAGFCDGCGKKLPTNWQYVSEPTSRDDASTAYKDERDYEYGRKSDGRDYEPLSYPDGRPPDGYVSPELAAARKQASSTLFVIAGIQLICGFAAIVLLGGMGKGNRGDEADMVLAVMVVEIIGLAVVFGLLGFWAMYQPLIPSILGLVLYVGVNLLAIAANPQAISSGWIIKIFIVIGLVRAIHAASKAR